MNRRRFIKSTAGGLVAATAARRAAAQSSPRLTRFVDPLPIPSVVSPGASPTTITMTQFQQKLHQSVPATTLWGYNGSFPGPTIETRKGSPVQIRWDNQLPNTHLLSYAIDRTLHNGLSAPDVRTVVHLHGAKVLPESDGYPEAWFTSSFAQTGPYWTTKVYKYPNDQQATTLWYHDHAVTITRLNVHAGLAGMYIIRDSWEDALNLPKGPYEIPLILMDRILNADGTLNYPVQGAVPAGVPPVWIPEFFGDVVLVNGKAFPFLDVEPRKYRFRLLNASNARFYHLQLQESNKEGRGLNKPGPSFRQIGTDGGLLPLPVTLSDLLIAPAERFDLVVDFSGLNGRYFVMTNDAPAPFPGGGEAVPPVVMQFRVASTGGRDTSTVPPLLNLPNLLDPRQAVKTRDLILAEADHPVTGDPIIGTLDNLRWDDPPTETPKAGSIEIWRLINTTGDWHPKHVHLVQFQILDRQPFDVDQYNNTGQLVFTGPVEFPLPNEIAARKDVVKAPAGYVTRIIAKFDLPTGTPVIPNHRYRYVWHCHILEHEDNEMMRPYDVVG